MGAGRSKLMQIILVSGDRCAGKSEFLDLLALHGVYTYQFHQGTRLHREDQKLAWKYRADQPASSSRVREIAITDASHYDPGVHRRFLEPQVWKDSSRVKQGRRDAIFWDCVAAITFCAISMRQVVAVEVPMEVFDYEELPLRDYFRVWDIYKHRWRIMRWLIREPAAAKAVSAVLAVLCAAALLRINMILHTLAGQSFGLSCMGCWIGILLLLLVAAQVPSKINLVTVVSDRPSQIERLCYRYSVDRSTAENAMGVVIMGGPRSRLRSGLNEPRDNGQRRERSERFETDYKKHGLKRVTRVCQWRSDFTLHNTAKTPTSELEHSCRSLLYGQLGMRMDSATAAASTVVCRIGLAVVASAVVLWFGSTLWTIGFGAMGRLVE